MGTQKQRLLIFVFIALFVGQTLPAFGQTQSIVPFELPPIPPKENQAPPYFDQIDYFTSAIQPTNVLAVKNVDDNISNNLNPDVAFVPIDQAVTKGRPNFNGVVLVADDSKIIFEHSYDPAKRYEKYSDEDINRQFMLGSMTKEFTAILVLKLVDRKLIDLEDSIQKYLPDTPKSWANIKVKNLLNHTSGFTYEYMSYTRACGFSTPEQGWKKLKRVNPSYAPGEVFHYANMNYFLLGIIVQNLTGRTLPEVLRSEITGPLSMDLTDVVGRSAAGTGLNPTQPGCYFAIGNMYSSPRDLLKWETALFNDKTVLSEETFNKMVNPEVATQHYYRTVEISGKKKTLVKVPGAYGLGIRISEIDGEPIYWHGGHLSNYTALFEHYPKRKKTVIVLANKTNEKVFDIANDVINAVFDLPTVPPPDMRKVIRTSSKHRGKRVTRVAPRLSASNRTLPNQSP